MVRNRLDKRLARVERNQWKANSISRLLGWTCLAYLMSQTGQDKILYADVALLGHGGSSLVELGSGTMLGDLLA